jgi:rare lipoprotein A
MASSALATEVFEDRLEHMSTLRSHSSEANRTGHVRLARATSSDEEEFAYRRPRHRVDHAAHSRKAASHRARHRTAHARRAVRHARAGRVRTAHLAHRAHPRVPQWTKQSLAVDRPTGRGQLGHGQTGVASYYWEPQRLASGGWFNPSAMTAAHKTLPFGTRVRVTHLGNGRSVEVKINDRGPYVGGRIIDLSKAAAGAIGMMSQGLARVVVEILGR